MTEPALPRLHGDGLLGRSVRFALTVTGPLAVGAAIGEGPWVAYAVLTGILGFSIDGGGPVRARLRDFAVAGVVVLAGTAVGTLAAGHVAAITVALALAALLYALLEPTDPSAALTGRFLCLALPIGALYVPVERVDVVAVAVAVGWGLAVSLAWDAATGLWRPPVAPRWPVIGARLRATGVEGVVFALIVAAAVATGFLATRALGIERAHWALFAIVLVLRTDETASRRFAVALMVGTPIGVGAALAYGALVSSQTALLAGMAVAALLRWPAQAFNDVLGIAALTAFIILLFDVIAVSTGVPSNAAPARLVDISLGCAFAVAALAVNHAVRWWLRRGR